MKKRWIIVAVASAVVVLAAGGGGTWYFTRPANHVNEVKVALALPAPVADFLPTCHEAVKARLKAPATAVFGGEEVTPGPSKYVAVGWVDAQNSFGARIRTLYLCTAYRGSNEWLAPEVTLRGQ